MSYLLYCIFRSAPLTELELPTGVDGKPLSIVGRQGLSVAASELRQRDACPDVASVLAYDQVVESFFRRQTIVPLRYGFTVPDRAGIDAALDDHHQQCDRMLQKLDGFAEMGIQVPAEGCEIDAAAAPSHIHSSAGLGISYLAAKKKYYGETDRLLERRNQLVEIVCQPLSGLFLRRKVEVSSSRADWLSLYFLVPRTSVEAFRAGGLQCSQHGLSQLKISGPWPPYNFADLTNIKGN